VVGWADAVADAVVDAVRGGDPAAAAVSRATAAPVPDTARQVRLRDTVRADELLTIVSKLDTVSVLALIVKAVAVASRRVPLRSDVPAPTDVAVQRRTPEGAAAPVVHVAALMSVSSLTTMLSDLETRAREGRLPVEGSAPATVTVVDLSTEGIAEGVVDATAAQPVVLTVGSVQVQPVVDGGRLVPGRTIALGLACDEQQVACDEAARWLACLCGLLEQPLEFLT
jgi:pyruvate/2-oxoglutarate dehydrogenase complex dihydrolipoamide acyltransferase (E2) component